MTARQIAALPGSGYDRLVALAKWLLPSLAGLVAGSLLIWPVFGGHDFSFVLAKDRVALATERMKITRAVYRGEDRKGQSFQITAGSALQKTSSHPIVVLSDLAAQLDMADGSAHIVAGSGRYDMESEALNIDGPVTMRAAGDYALNTRDVRIDLATRTAESAGPVDGEMPLGRFSADKITANIADHIVTLEGRTRLHIVQARTKRATE